jgi:hypothetical protein
MARSHRTLVREIISSRAFRDACFECTFDRVTRQVERAVIQASAEQRPCFFEARVG